MKLRRIMFNPDSGWHDYTEGCKSENKHINSGGPCSLVGFLLTPAELEEVWNACKRAFVRPNPTALKSGADEWCEMRQSFEEWLKQQEDN